MPWSVELCHNQNLELDRLAEKLLNVGEKPDRKSGFSSSMAGIAEKWTLKVMPPS